MRSLEWKVSLLNLVYFAAARRADDHRGRQIQAVFLHTQNFEVVESELVVVLWLGFSQRGQVVADQLAQLWMLLQVVLVRVAEHLAEISEQSLETCLHNNNYSS